MDGCSPARDEKLALYPHTRTLALGTYFGKKSGSLSQHRLDFAAVQVPMARPPSPWTATMLMKGFVSNCLAGCVTELVLASERGHTPPRAGPLFPGPRPLGCHRWGVLGGPYCCFRRI